MTKSTNTPSGELQHFKELVSLIKKTPDWDEHPEFSRIMENLCTNTSKEAHDMREIMFRMVGAKLRAKELQQSK